MPSGVVTLTGTFGEKEIIIPRENCQYPIFLIDYFLQKVENDDPQRSVLMAAIADLVEDLFHAKRKPDGKEWTNKEVAQELAKHGLDVDPSYLSKLRSGKIANPGRDTLLALCRFFRVPPSHFFPELAEINSAPPPVIENQDSLQVALRSSGLDPEVRTKLAELIHALQPSSNKESN